ncbi:MAG: 4Fe-4S binding protein [Bacteroidales bacterium]|nr:4Fe-4S binding protein [Bacteroidales bacterium]
MLRKARVVAATIFFISITLLFLDFTGTLHAWLGWMVKVQFFPAILALNVVAMVVLLLLTLLFGRVYCSVICPLGVFQDLFSWIAGKRKKNRFHYTKSLGWLRYGVLVLFIAALLGSVGAVSTILEPYSSYGNIVANLFAPVWQAGNNVLAYFAERADSYAFYSVDIYVRSIAAFVLAVVTTLVLAFLAWKGGRTYCNTVCPVGTILGLLSRFSWFKPVIDTTKCNGCTLCERNCKSSCINSKEHKIDYSRCVACMDCIDKCNRGAISFVHAKGVKSGVSCSEQQDNGGRRKFLAATAVLATASLAKAQEDKVDGGLAVVLDKKAPQRTTRIVPPGALGLANMENHCVGCQLCITACPNGVLRPSTDLMNFLKPYSSYERGYCRPECTACSNICPAGAIRPVSVEEKSSIQIGHAVWIKKNCLPVAEGVSCGKCAKVCPVGAIQMVKISCRDCKDKCDGKNRKCEKVPVVNAERCIGCGACENLCPSRPFSAIYVEGHEVHKFV